MNTITINTEVDGQVSTITYTETDITNFIKKTEELSDTYKRLEAAYKENRDLRHNVRDFFSEVEWQDGEQTVSKGDVNDLLERIGSHKLTTQYQGTFTITGSFIVEAEDEDEAESMFVENADVCFNDGDYTMDNVEVNDIEEHN